MLTLNYIIFKTRQINNYVVWCIVYLRSKARARVNFNFNMFQNTFNFSGLFIVVKTNSHGEFTLFLMVREFKIIIDARNNNGTLTASLSFINL